MNITSGPTITAYAARFNLSVEDVIAWVSDYVNHPENYPHPEPTESARKTAIGNYMKQETDYHNPRRPRDR